MVRIYLTLEEVVQEYGFSKSWLYKAANKRLIRHYKPHGRLYFKRADIEEFMSQGLVLTATDSQKPFNQTYSKQHDYAS